jgi:hypothetical protein
MVNFDNFSITVLAGAVLVVLVLGLLMLLDKGKRAAPPVGAPSKVAGKQ